MEIKEELEKAEHREAQSDTRARDSLNIQISHFNSAADY